MVAPGTTWATLLEAAIDGVGVATVFQPIVDLARGTTVGFEALSRFSGGIEARPDRWFAAARTFGCAAELESVALRVALNARPELPKNTFLTLNVSPDLLSSSPVRQVLRQAGDLSGVVVELTEQVPIESYDSLEGDLISLRSAGALIAVDDAGAGYAGLRHLLKLRPSIIKLDRELVQDVDRDEAKVALIEMLGTFADRVDAWLLAEGIERQGELDMLATMGTPLGQGFHLARPGEKWPAIDPDVAMSLVTRSRQEEQFTVRRLVELAPVVGSITEARGLLGGSEDSMAVVVDHHHRPVGVCTSELAQLGVLKDVLRVNLDAPIREVTLRALTRDSEDRFRPVACVDNAGRFIGLVRLERLIHSSLSVRTPSILDAIGRAASLSKTPPAVR
jgi:EAL domain-containing protein (putative c-di-GMP-specific phosphodiesterase class I)